MQQSIRKSSISPTHNRKHRAATLEAVQRTQRHNSHPYDTVLIQRKPGCACGGGCPRCQLKSLQPKLRIGQPNDKYEQEADRIADQVMRMPEPGIQRQPT